MVMTEAEVSARTILHVDMDAFYTSVEQRDHPELLGRPVVVGADSRGGAGRGVVAAASYEARAFGVHSAMPISRAYRLCPQAAYLRGDMAKYGEVSGRILTILRGYTDLVEPLSIDEAFLDVTGSLGLYGGARALAEALKGRIRAQEQLSSSVGIAPNKFLAKVASDLEKPDGLVEVPPGQEEAFLRDLQVDRLWGVGPRTAEALRGLGLRTIGDVARLDPSVLIRRFGRHGEHLAALSRGRDDRPVVVDWEPQSVGRETTFEQDTADPRRIHQTLVELAGAVARRLRKQEIRGRVVTLKHRDENFVTRTRRESLAVPTDDAATLLEKARALLGRVPAAGRKVRLLGISVSGLERASDHPRQLDLFRDQERGERLNRAWDAVEDRFGEATLRPASALGREASAGTEALLAKRRPGSSRDPRV
jgi:nucleotidyltransferase/DNA polymerase involved in DNA repair